MDDIKAVSSQEFGNKIASALMIFYGALKPIIMPIALIGITFGVIVLLVGNACHSKVLTKMATTDIVLAFGGILFYFAIPLLLGLIKLMGGALG